MLTGVPATTTSFTQICMRLTPRSVSHGALCQCPGNLTPDYACCPIRSSALKLSQRMAASRGMGAGMGGGGHANNPVFMFQADWAKNKWKGAVFVLSVAGLGTYVPWFCLSFAQRKAGVW